jgi:osmoprotectant transport system substrate-binding protein
VVREEVLKTYPDMVKVLTPVFESLDAPTLRGLNARIQVEGELAKDVAASYLKDKGFIK